MTTSPHESLDNRNWSSEPLTGLDEPGFYLVRRQPQRGEGRSIIGFVHVFRGPRGGERTPRWIDHVRHRCLPSQWRFDWQHTRCDELVAIFREALADRERTNS